MNQNNLLFCYTSPEPASVNAYLQERFYGSPLASVVGELMTQPKQIKLVTRTEPPANADFYTDWKSPSCGDWLFGEILAYGQKSQDTMVLFEDGNSSPSDRLLREGLRPPCLFYHQTVYWPVEGETISRNTVEAALTWGGGFRMIVVFSMRPKGFIVSKDANIVSEAAFLDIASSICRIVTNVYDGGGYLCLDFKSGDGKVSEPIV